ncbi:MAG: single-stranded DNA-binding protein [Verrucomicrobia bacterium]|nr:MAG: single-stranded DNA-binding protein [Verrucomicrobiota bacterium]TAE87865.1 MAG: single-stranded DNA-binding protein [Verrucomicrobiota bacterium]TAF25608.1 MAG: single-stranded DNA-binding protein [Verrucomicrobiota bacterium]TAF41325.1 MAG: single-stranded DNA-binding protein [Verrucomicrobiota bacterium]
MRPVEAAKKILDTMLGHLGFHPEIEVHDSEDEPCLQILTPRSELLIGKDGERLDDLQYLVNRVLRKHFPKAPRVRIDCEHYRAIQEDKLSAEVRAAADSVRATGKPYKMRPLNAYYRRLVHNALVDESDIESVSPSGDDRLKRILIRARGKGEVETPTPGHE